MKQCILFFLLCSIYFSSSSFAQNVALSFDDGFNPERQPQAALWNKQILSHLKAHNVETIFYATGKNVNSPEGLKLVADWGNDGHQIGNHTYQHYSMHSSKISSQQYIADIAKNETLLQNLPGWTKRFRFPYLKEGKTREKRDAIRDWLSTANYRSGAVSIDSSDWYYNRHYLALSKQQDDKKLNKLKEAYLEHLWGRAQYYDSLSKKVLNRSVEHVLLLHVNAINAAYLSDVIAMFKSKQWQIISPEQAYADPIYAQTIDALPAGESILWQLGKQNGVENLRYPAEDSRYERDKIDYLVKELNNK